MAIYTSEDQSVLGEYINELDEEINKKQKIYIALKHLSYEHQKLLIKKIESVLDDVLLGDSDKNEDEKEN